MAEPEDAHAQTDEEKYQQTQEVMQAVVAMYADTKDQDMVREAGRSTQQQQKMVGGDRKNELCQVNEMSQKSQKSRVHVTRILFLCFCMHVAEPRFYTRTYL